MNRKGFVARAPMESTLASICRYLDDSLRLSAVADYANALNGLQLENDGTVSRVCAAVDASLSTVTAAVRAGCDLLLVHHGLFWNGLTPMTGKRRELFKVALEGNLAVYSAHLPLDTGTMGNSMLLAQACLPAPGCTDGWQPFFDVKGTLIGCRARLDPPLRREAVAARLSQAVGGQVRVCPGGPEDIRQVGVITGAAGSEARRVAGEGIDALITGEGPHWTYALAEEVSLNIFYGGHYATETFAVKALAAHVGERFGLPWDFIHLPTGL